MRRPWIGFVVGMGVTALVAVGIELVRDADRALVTTPATPTDPQTTAALVRLAALEKQIADAAATARTARVPAADDARSDAPARPASAAAPTAPATPAATPPVPTTVTVPEGDPRFRRLSNEELVERAGLLRATGGGLVELTDVYAELRIRDATPEQTKAVRAAIVTVAADTANAHFEKADYRRTAAILGPVLDLVGRDDPTTFPLSYRLGFSRANTGEMAAARDEYEALLRKPEVYVGIAWVGLVDAARWGAADAHERLGDTTRARQGFTALLTRVEARSDATAMSLTPRVRERIARLP